MRRVIVLALVALALPAKADSLPDGDPRALGFDPAKLDRVGEAVRRAVDAKTVPGAVVLVGREGKIALARAYGLRRSRPFADDPMTRDTIFDLASLTKPVATASSIMVLVDRGELRLDDRLGVLLPEFDNHGKGAITVEKLLRHRSGLIADNPLSDYADGPDRAWERLATLGLQSEPGTRFLYSDVNYLILARIVERVTGRAVDRFAAEHLFAPLDMADAGFRGARTRLTIRPDVVPSTVGGIPIPIPARVPAERAGDLGRIAPTGRDRKPLETPFWGVVHDPRARALGGVAGHAGLFGTADDLALFAQMLLDRGRSRDGVAVLTPETAAAIISPGDTPKGQRRGLGWDIDTPFSGPRGRVFGPTSFGHTGFTGTSLWIDPETRTFVILLTSRLFPDEKGGSPTALRAEVATLVGRAIDDAPVRPVLCGIDVLERDRFALLKGKRVGLVTNHTGRTRDGRATIDVLHRAPGVKLVALFSPEHGIRGAVDRDVPDSKDEATGLPVYSLYGERRKPSAESLANVDVLVYDIQDIGTRFYTYISTLGLCLEAAASGRVPVIVLDRPNPIGGEAVGGPVSDPDLASFIAFHPMPVRHGMTVGEIARMFVAERKIATDLTVIPCEGWRRSDLFDRTGLEWVDPSPNMRSLTEAVLYPGVGLLEATNLATGRGTDTPFERVGAPWIDGREWARALNGLGLKGVRFVPIRFTPKERQHAGKECSGVQILVTDRATFDPIDLGFGLASTLRYLHPRDWQVEGFLRMVADRKTHEAMARGAGVATLKAISADELREFLGVRSKYLLYR